MFKSFKTVVLLASLSGLLLFIGSLFSEGGLWIALFIALAMNIGSYWFSDKLAITMARAKPASEQEYPWYHEMVRDLATKAKMPMPRLYVSPSPQPNAFATGRNPRHAAVCVNQGLIAMLDRDEMEGVLAHELSHVDNRDILIGSVAATIATAITFLARFALFFGGGRGSRDNPIASIAMIFLAPIAAMLIQFAVTRSRETTADTSGGAPVGQAARPRECAAEARRGWQGGREAAAAGEPCGDVARVQPALHLPVVRGGAGRGRLRQPLPYSPEDRGAGGQPAPHRAGDGPARLDPSRRCRRGLPVGHLSGSW